MSIECTTHAHGTLLYIYLNLDSLSWVDHAIAFMLGIPCVSVCIVELAVQLNTLTVSRCPFGTKPIYISLFSDHFATHSNQHSIALFIYTMITSSVLKSTDRAELYEILSFLNEKIPYNCEVCNDIIIILFYLTKHYTVPINHTRVYTVMPLLHILNRSIQ